MVDSKRLNGQFNWQMTGCKRKPIQLGKCHKSLEYIQQKYCAMKCSKEAMISYATSHTVVCLIFYSWFDFGSGI